MDNQPIENKELTTEQPKGRKRKMEGDENFKTRKGSSNVFLCGVLT